MIFGNGESRVAKGSIARGRWTLLAILLCPGMACLAGPVDPKNPPQGRFSDEWAEIHLAGRKVGYAHTTMGREGEVISTAANFHLVMGRDEQPIKIGMTQHTTETLAGIPLTFGSEMDMSVMKSATQGKVQDGKVTIVTSQYGMNQTQTFDYPSGALMSWGTFRESLLRGFTPGTQYTLKVYAPELRLDGPVDAITKIDDWEPIDIRGKKVKGQKVTVTMQSPVGSFEMVSWVDAEGVPLRAKVPMPGVGDMEIVSADQATALADFAPPEFFNNTVVRAKRSIERGKAQRIKYKLTATSPGTPLGDFPTTDMQTVVSKADNVVELLVERRPHKPGAHPEGRVTNPDLAEYLDSNLMINTSDPKLIELAKQAADGEKEPFALGDKLRRFVTEYVHTKSLNIGFATASEVARTREGDCSEHGLLLAALGRINGLPSRVVVGLAYVPVFGRQDDIFGYHLWTQFYIDGRWVDFDAALRETQCSPARIAFAVSSLKNAGLADLSLPLINKIGAIEIDILELETAP